MTAYRRGRERRPESVYLNVYDLHPSNNALRWLGLGLYHTGVEVYGSEWTYSGGSGVFSHSPRRPPGLAERREGVRFHTTIELGEIQLSSAEIEEVIRRISSNFFSGDEYHLLTQNCNTFSDALSIELLGHPIPGHINRMANMGVCFGNCMSGAIGAPPLAVGRVRENHRGTASPVHSRNQLQRQDTPRRSLQSLSSTSTSSPGRRLAPPPWMPLSSPVRKLGPAETSSHRDGTGDTLTAFSGPGWTLSELVPSSANDESRAANKQNNNRAAHGSRHVDADAVREARLRKFDGLQPMNAGSTAGSAATAEKSGKAESSDGTATGA